jgi:hypothetical protein
MRYDIYHATIDSEACGLATQLFYVRPRYEPWCTAALANYSCSHKQLVGLMQFVLLQYKDEMPKALKCAAIALD